jgi:hypothetical protein
MAEVLTRSLTAQDDGPLRVIEALRWPTPFGAGLRLYLGAGAPEVTRAGTTHLGRAQRIGQNMILNGRVEDGPVTLGVGEDRVVIATSAPETAVFDNLDVILAERHGESPEDVAAWLAWHVALHQPTALLILDRAPAEDGFAAAFAQAADLSSLARVMVVTAPLPLGLPRTPAAFDTAYAPRAKSRRARPDPWRAPLGEPAVLDALRWRFLARADAVIRLDPTEFVQPPDDGSNLFDAIRQSHTGLVPILGEAVFPWRVRKGAAPRWHDHICRSDPPVAAPHRWGVAPKRLGSGPLWTPHAVAGAPALQDESLVYFRAMALAHPEAEVAELANKDLLILDDSLNAAAQAAAANPIQPPSQNRPALKDGPKILAPPPSGRTVVVTCMKNEGPFLLEWIAYHRLIGVDDFLVYTNDCEDGTDQMLDLLAARGIVQRRDNPFREVGGKPQQSALDAAGSEEVVQNAGWLISMDVDEFINVHVGGNRLPDLYAAVEGASLISLTWRLFGNSDIAAYQDLPVTQQFVRCAPRLIRRPHQAWGFKTLFRNQGLFNGMGVHRPRGFLGGPATWVNGSGKAMPERLFKTGWRSDVQTYGYDLVTLNHYAVRSVESFLVKRDRGRVNHVSRDQGEAYWFRMNNNDEQDLSIQVHTANLTDAIDDLKRDPKLRAAHDHAVAWHRAKIEKLRADPEYAKLYDSLTSERMQRLSRMLRHFGMNVFLSGPSVIPDKVFDPNLPPNFLFNVAAPQGPAAD